MSTRNPTVTERAIPDAKTNRVVVGIFALVALAIAFSLGALIAMLLFRSGPSPDPTFGGVLSLIASFVVFFGVTGVQAATFALRPRTELMRVEGWRILTATLAACGVASAFAYHWAVSLSWLAMALFCVFKEPRVQSWLHALGMDPSPAANGPVGLTGGGPGYVKIGTFRGIEIFAHWTIPLGGIAISAFAGFDPREAVYYTIGYLCLIVLHELGHVLAGRMLGLRVFSVQISGVGGLCRIEIPRKASHAIMLYSAGLLAQAVLLVAAILYHSFVGVPPDAPGRPLLQSFIVVNLFIIVLNLIPSRALGGVGTDGRVLLQLLRHVIWKDPYPFPRIDLLPGDKAPVFPPETSLLAIPGMIPDGFDHGVEILNDRTTPMLFVMATLMRNLERTQEDVILLMAAIHNKGGALIPLPTRERAEEVAKAITAESAAAGHKLTCRAVVRGIL